MSDQFSEILKMLREERGLSQQRLGELLYVDRSTISNWETGRRIPDAVLIHRLSDCLGVDVGILLGAAQKAAERPAVIMVDDERIILSGGMPILEKAIPGAAITGFTRPSKALEFTKNNRIDIAFLDIEMGMTSGLDLCRELMAVQPQINVVFLTAYPEYSLDAWDTGASGFLVKPLTVEGVQRQLTQLRYPVRGL